MVIAHPPTQPFTKGLILHQILLLEIPIYRTNQDEDLELSFAKIGR